MLMLHRGHLGTLWVCTEAFDGRYYSKVLPEWMVLRCWSKTSMVIIISHYKILKCILLGQDDFVQCKVETFYLQTGVKFKIHTCLQT